MNDPLISIIVPVLNGKSFLDRCFSTLSKQTYSNLEIIFVDNGSIDGSRENINKYCSERENYYLLDCSKPGPGAARNRGLDFASGKYISFLDVDDELEPDKHIKLLKELKHFPQAAMAVGQTKIKYSYGREIMSNLGSLNVGLNISPVPGLLWLRQFQHNPHPTSFLIKKTIIDSDRITFADIQFGEDVAFNVLIGLQYDVVIIDKLVSTYHRHSDSAVSIANQHISTTERYFHFYKNFALPYFYSKKGVVPFNDAFNISEKIAFGLIMKLIYNENNNKYKKILNDLQLKNLLNKYWLRIFIYSILPYKPANYLSQYIYR